MTPVPRLQRIRPEAKIVLALGSNLGDRQRMLADAVADITALAGVRVDAVSPLYETPALRLDGVDLDAPAYLNAVLVGHSSLDPDTLLDALHDVERGHGRERTEDTVRWGDRTLDIDIVVYGGVVRDDERLTLPHPRAFERAFVLEPWLAVDPFAVLPGYGAVAALRAAATDAVRPYRGDAGESDAEAAR